LLQIDYRPPVTVKKFRCVRNILKSVGKKIAVIASSFSLHSPRLNHFDSQKKKLSTLDRLRQGAILKQTASVVDKEELGLNLCWQPEGRCNSFTRQSILAKAPSSSGVYGLVNFDRQIFIGESDNIREALLRHENQIDFKSERLKPTGFTFELCGAQSRKLWAAELIARFQPMLQKEGVLIQPWSASNAPMLNETDQGDWQLGTGADHQEFPIHEREKHLKTHRSFRIKRTHAFGMASILVASAAIILYLALPADYSDQTHANGASPAPGETTSLTPQNGSSLRNESSAKTAETPTDERVEARRPKLNRDGSSSAKTADTIQANLASSRGTETADSLGKAALDKTWAVQISAAPTKNVADKLVQQLKAEGYDGYVVEVNVKNQTYYRVRVGRFPKRQEAESTRQSLALHESYEQAFVSPN
jgi:sporulation related protein